MESLVSFFTTYVRPFLDVVVLAFLIYQVYKILLQNNALPAIKGVVAAEALYALAYIFQLDTILWILNRRAGALIIIVAIIFQSEIRNFFIKVGQSRFLQSRHRTIGTEVESVVSAAEILSSMKRGALVVFSRQTGLKNIIDIRKRYCAPRRCNNHLRQEDCCCRLFPPSLRAEGNKKELRNQAQGSPWNCRNHRCSCPYCL